MESHFDLALWLAGLTAPGADPERARATESGQDLLTLAVSDGEIAGSGEEVQHQFAEWLADLVEDGWAKGDLRLAPGEEAPVGLRDDRLLSRFFRIRLTPEGWRAVPSLRTAVRPPSTPVALTDAETRDVFVSHASEDKDAVARPLAVALQMRGWRVWFDEYELTIGDGLRRTLERGLATSRFGIVILSPDFFAKEWPQRELDGLVARETTSGDKVVLPVWHGVDAAYVAHFSPTLADRLAASSSLGADALAGAIEKALLGGGLQKVEAPQAPPPSLGSLSATATNPVLDAVMGQNPAVLREVLKREVTAYHASLDNLLNGRFSERPDEATAQEIGREVLVVVERLATQLLPLVEHDVDQLEQALRTVSRRLSRPAINGDTFWYEVRQWAVWWLVHVLGAYATRREAFSALRPLLVTPVEADHSEVTIPLGYNFLNDAAVAIGQALAPTGQRWLSPTWEHLAASVRDSASLRAGWPELFEEESDPRRALAEWSLLQTLGLGLAGERSVGFWALGESGRMARRFARDGRLRERLAKEAYGLSLAELDAAAPEAFSLVHGFQEGFTSGSEAARLFLDAGA